MELPHRVATATKAANQKSMVRASTAQIANLWAAAGKRVGARVRYATARRVHMEVKSMKSTLSGDQLPAQGPLYQSMTDFVSVMMADG
jgi:hypothetical protein